MLGPKLMQSVVAGILAKVTSLDQVAAEPDRPGQPGPGVQDLGRRDVPRGVTLLDVDKLVQVPGLGEPAVEPVIEGKVIHDSQCLRVVWIENPLMDSQVFRIEV